MEPTIGMKVKVYGRYADFTDHLDGAIVTVVNVDKRDNGYVQVRDDKGDYWYVRVNDLAYA